MAASTALSRNEYELIMRLFVLFNYNLRWTTGMDSKVDINHDCGGGLKIYDVLNEQDIQITVKMTLSLALLPEVTEKKCFRIIKNLRPGKKF